MIIKQCLHSYLSAFKHAFIALLLKSVLCRFVVGYNKLMAETKLLDFTNHLTVIWSSLLNETQQSEKIYDVLFKEWFYDQNKSHPVMSLRCNDEELKRNLSLLIPSKRPILQFNNSTLQAQTPQNGQTHSTKTLSVFGHFVGLAPKGLNSVVRFI